MVKYDPIKNINYIATVVQAHVLEPLEGLDNLAALRAFGMQALVSKDTAPGAVGILFSTEVQLSEEFARENNLHRHTNLNSDPTKAGYLEDNRRVKAIKLRGHRSDSLFMPLESLAYLGINVTDLKVGDVFDSINGHEICRKYVIKEPKEHRGPQARVRKVDLKNFPVHVDSENWWRNEHKIPADAVVTITQKLHGTSIRFGRVLVERDLKWYEKLAQRLGVQVKTHDYRFVVGSRMVVKSIDGEAESAGKQHFYAEDEWSKYVLGRGLDKQTPEGYLVYGELVGYTSDGKPIQKNYTYGCDPVDRYTTDPDHRSQRLYIYRVATITPQGLVTDLSWEQTKRFAKDIGADYVPEFQVLTKYDFNADTWMDRRYYDDWLVGSEDFKEQPIILSPDSPVDEGVCIRYDGPNGIVILKAKAPIFLGHETKLLDAEEIDIESEESNA